MPTSPNSHIVFDILKKGRVQEAKQGFLQMDPLAWKDDKLYKDFRPQSKA